LHLQAEDGHIYPFAGPGLGLEFAPIVLEHPDAIIRTTGSADL
jgi:galactonate dehydratase